MHHSVTNEIWVVAAGTAVLFFFGLAYVAVLLSSHRRVTEAQRLKLEEVRRSEQRYRDLFEHSMAGMMKFDIDSFAIIEANEALQRIYGCSSPEELAQCFADIPTSSREDIRAMLSQHAVVTDHELHMSRGDGADLWILFSARQVDGERLAHGVVIDITERKASEEKVRQQAALLDEAQDAIMVTDPQGRVGFWNSGAELTYGWQRRETFGRPIRELLFDADREYLLAMEDVHQFGEWNGEQHHRRKDGKEILIQSRWKMVRSPDSGRQVILIVNTDVTEKKRLEAEFVRAQRMESIALLTSGIAHDLHNILAPVAMSVGLLRDKLSDSSSLAILAAVEESAQSGLELVRNILTFGHGVVGERVRLDACELVQQVLTILRQGLRDNIRVEWHANGFPHFVSGDANQLKQVVLNIAVNARDAMPDGGTMAVEVSELQLSEAESDRFRDGAAGRHVVVSIRDTGMGIPQDRVDRIFEPFYTSKEGAGGTGLGLSIAAGIVKSHDGFITVESAVDQGSTFRIYLPAAGEEAD